MNDLSVQNIDDLHPKLVIIEQAIKEILTAYVFQPNVAATWSAISNSVSDYLNTLWQQGTLVGATPDGAYNVSIGLDSTMTPNDILDGIVIVAANVALTHPAEFTTIRISQQMQAAG